MLSYVLGLKLHTGPNSVLNMSALMCTLPFPFTKTNLQSDKQQAKTFFPGLVSSCAIIGMLRGAGQGQVRCVRTSSLLTVSTPFHQSKAVQVGFLQLVFSDVQGEGKWGVWHSSLLHCYSAV